jgi:hypothetical protein
MSMLSRTWSPAGEDEAPFGRRALLAYRGGRPSAATPMYLAQHHATFAAAYVVIRDVTVGWLERRNPSAAPV